MYDAPHCQSVVTILLGSSDELNIPLMGLIIVLYLELNDWYDSVLVPSLFNLRTIDYIYSFCQFCDVLCFCLLTRPVRTSCASVMFCSEPSHLMR